MEALQDVGGLALHETLQGVSEAIDPVDILQIEVFTASAVKNIGRFNCEFVKGEKLGRGAFGVAWRCHHLVDESRSKRGSDAPRPPGTTPSASPSTLQGLLLHRSCRV